MNNDQDVLVQIENQPWYQSSAGPKVSATVKSLAGLIIPLLMNLGIVKTGTPWLDSAIDILCIAGFGGYALYGYARAKITYKKQLSALSTQIKSLGGVAQL